MHCQVRLAAWLRDASRACRLPQSRTRWARSPAAVRTPARARRRATPRKRQQLLERWRCPPRLHAQPGGERLSVVFMFPGGGAQYAGMARGPLRDRCPSSAKRWTGASRSCADASARTCARCSSRATPRRQPPNAQLQRPSLQLPLVFLIEYALAQLWESLGVKADCADRPQHGRERRRLRGRRDEPRGCAGPGAAARPADGRGAGRRHAQRADERRRPARRGSAPSSTSPRPTARCCRSPRARSRRSMRCRRASRPKASKRDACASTSPRTRGCSNRSSAASAPTSGHPAASRRRSRSSRTCTGDWLTDAEATDPEYWVRHLRNTVRFADGVQRLLQDKSRLTWRSVPASILGSFVRQSHDAIVQRMFALAASPATSPSATTCTCATVAGRLWASGLARRRHAALAGQGGPRVRCPATRSSIRATGSSRLPADSQQDGDEALFPQRVAVRAGVVLGTPLGAAGHCAGRSAAPQVWCVFHHGDPVARSCITRTA